MRMLFEIDKQDYDPSGTVLRRPSARGIILNGETIALIYSQKYRYYKFPGGGIEADENIEDALIREVLEETGLTVVRDSIQEYGQVHRIQKGAKEDVFIQDNYYFLCDVSTAIQHQHLDPYEAEAGFTLEYVTPQQAIQANQKALLDDFNQGMSNRDAAVLQILIQEGYFQKPSD